ncbi:unnamed protein product, partial [Cuscuta epithymum]
MKTGAKDSPLPSFTTEQWQVLISAFGNLSSSIDPMAGKFDTDVWIIDTGVTNHICGNLTLLSQIKHIESYSVGLPDGQMVIASKVGCVIVSDRLILEHILCVPKLNCNLISVSQLCVQLDCFVLFTHNMCVIQDRLSRKLIGMGEGRNGLFYLRDDSFARALTVKDESHNKVVDLWHQRLGHPSSQVIEKLAPMSGLKNFGVLPCDVCFRARQTRTSFPNSSSRSSGIFELIHCDLW